MNHMGWILGAVTVAVPFAGCGNLDPSTKTACTAPTECGSGSSCIVGQCVPGTCDDTRGGVTAMEAYKKAKARALSWSDAAVLQEVETPDVNGSAPMVRADGTLMTGSTMIYRISFISASKAQAYWLNVDAAGSLTDEFAPFDAGGSQSDAIAEGWIDSPAAMHIADSNGGCAFRGAHPAAGVGLALISDAVMGQRVVWDVVYGQTISGAPQLLVTLDAWTGEVLATSN